MQIEKKIIHKKLSFSEIEFKIEPIGENILILIRGGEIPHIGSCVMSIPRKSLQNNEKISCTSSVLNVIGHKDEKICRIVAEKFCKKFQTVVVCVGGFHCENLTEKQIFEVIDACEEI